MRRRNIGLVGCASVLAFALAACGGSSDTSQTAAGMQGDDQQPRGLAGSGEVVQVSDSTAQVRNDRSGQAAVTWNSSTKFSQTVSGSTSDLKAGKCVVARSDSDGGTASTIEVTDKVDGECQGAGMRGGPGGPGGQGGPGGPSGEQGSGDRPEPPPGDRPEGAPEGAPSDMPSGGPQGQGGFGNITMGEIKSVANGKIVVVAVQFTPPSGNDQNAEQASPTTSDKTVEINSSTKVTKNVSAKAADVVVGKCVVSRGESDSTGKITASTIVISTKASDACSLGGFGGGRPGRSSSQSSSS